MDSSPLTPPAPAKVLAILQDNSCTVLDWTGDDATGDVSFTVDGIRYFIYWAGGIEGVEVVSEDVIDYATVDLWEQVRELARRKVRRVSADEKS